MTTSWNIFSLVLEISPWNHHFFDCKHGDFIKMNTWPHLFISLNHVNDFQLLLGNIDYIGKFFVLFADIFLYFIFIINLILFLIFLYFIFVIIIVFFTLFLYFIFIINLILFTLFQYFIFIIIIMLFMVFLYFIFIIIIVLFRIFLYFIFVINLILFLCSGWNNFINTIHWFNMYSFLSFKICLIITCEIFN